MEFWRLFEQYLRDLHRGVMRRIEAHLAPVHHAIDWWLGDLFEKPLPDDWREQWHALLARMEAEHRVRFDPTSADQVADWIQWWAGRCGLLRTASHSNSVSRFSATALVTVIGPDDRSADEIDNGQPAE